MANALTALSGAILGQYQKSCDINLGSGTVTIALASLIIGETLVGKGSMFRKITGVISGNCLCRFLTLPVRGNKRTGEWLKVVHLSSVKGEFYKKNFNKKFCQNQALFLNLREKLFVSYRAAYFIFRH